MGNVAEFSAKSKTEQHIEELLEILKSAPEPVTYEGLQVMTGARKNEAGTRLIGGLSYDVVYYSLATLVALGLVKRFVSPNGPGRPRILFVWADEDSTPHLRAVPD
ncbi:MAG TPA: hypothetical protein VH593_27020 [Ktedonobacteraceae bacterium]